MIKLSEQLAQKIVDKMMTVIPYNVIITDEQGVIIGSGDPERIHQFHSVAKKVMEFKRTIEIYKDTLVGVKIGVNCPIFFEGRLVGVIGITGNPDIVKTFSELVSVTAELLINQEYVLNERKIKEREREEFLYEVVYESNEYSQSFIERGLSLGIDLTIPHTAVVISFNEEAVKQVRRHLKSFMQKDEYYLTLNPSTIVAFMYSDKLLIKRLERYFDERHITDIYLGIGLTEHIIANSVKQGFTALTIGKGMENYKPIHLYEDIHFISILTNFKNDFRLDKIVEKLNSEGKQADLFDTLAAYVYNNGEVNTTSDILHIHRNTLNYRLDKIQEVTGKDPRNLIELFELFTAYVVSRL